MILKMLNQTQLSKQDKKKFIPFINERNHMGQIIKNKQRDKQYFKSIQVFQNLKKTTKQYFFDKKYQKMKQKLSRTKLSMEPKQPNYDNQVRKCFKSLQKSQLLTKCKTLSDTSFTDCNTFFVDLNQKLNQNISTLKQEIQKNRSNKLLKPKKINFKYKTFHNHNLRQTKLNQTTPTNNQNQYNQQNYNLLKHSRKKTLTIPNQQINTQIKIISEVNKQIFKNISKQSQNMADFTNCGLKYKHMVKTQKKNPWKKWYVDYRVEIFPGQTLKLKKLQKSIYD